VVLNLKIRNLLLPVLGLAALFGLASCGEDGPNKDGFYDSITNSCQLKTEYKDKDFYTQGIGMARLVTATDGDTCTFELLSDKTTDSKNLRIRFSCVNTPESTGGVEKWGKSASLFTKDKVTNAYEIVLQAETTPASHDSYGERYLGYVWYRNSEKDNFKNLNLLLVENGYSPNKALEGDYYTSYFNKAEKFANNKSLHIWSDEEDPNFDDNPVEVDLKTLSQNWGDYWSDEANNGSKVHFNAYLSSVNAGNTYTWEATQIIDGKEYSVNIYSGYSNAPGSTGLIVGNYYSLTGTVQKHGGSYQVSGITFVADYSGDDINIVKELKSKYFLQFDDSIEYKSHFYRNLYSAATITEAKVEGTTLKLTASAQRQTKNGLVDTADTFTFNIPVKAGTTVSSNIVGKGLITSGIQETSGVITVLNLSKTNMTNYVSAQ